MNDYQILIVEDDKVQRMIIEKYLKESEYQVIQAREGAEALKILQKHTPDLILLDVHMPVLDGFQTLKEIRKQPNLSHIPVLFLSSNEKDIAKIKGLELGADDYITKPFNAKLLITRIKAVLRRTERHQKEKGAMKGDLADLGLADLLQNLAEGMKTAKIILEEMNGVIYIQDETLLYVQQGKFTGEQALTRLLLLNKGTFSVLFGELPEESMRDPQPLMSILMKVVAKVDEVSDIIRMTGLKNRIIKIKDDIADFPEIAKVKKYSPAGFVEILALMEGDLSDNLFILSKASKKGKIQMKVKS